MIGGHSIGETSIGENRRYAVSAPAAGGYPGGTLGLLGVGLSVMLAVGLAFLVI